MVRQLVDPLFISGALVSDRSQLVTLLSILDLRGHIDAWLGSLHVSRLLLNCNRGSLTLFGSLIVIDLLQQVGLTLSRSSALSSVVWLLVHRV